MEIKRWKCVKYTEKYCVKVMWIGDDELRVALIYKIYNIVSDSCEMQGWKRQCKMEVKWQMCGKYSKEYCIKDSCIKDDELRVGFRYKIYNIDSDSCEVQGWRRQSLKKVKGQKSGKYSEEYCIKDLRIMDKELRVGFRNKIYDIVLDSCKMQE